MRVKFAAAAALAFACLPVAAQQQIDDIVRAAQGRVGASAELLESGKSLLSLHAREHFPMQSVYKLPISMAVLHQVDRGKLKLDGEVHVDKAEYIPKSSHSPLRDEFPNGITVTLRELLRLAVAESDGSASDVLLRLLGGSQPVMVFLRDHGVDGVQVLDTERALAEDYSLQYRNWATPDGAVAILRTLIESSALSTGSRDLLLKFMTETTTFPARIKGLLPAGAKVAHKTGSSGTRDGVTAATNDIGVITLPDGRHVAIAVFVSDSRADDAARDAVIANLARAAWNLAGAPDRAVSITIDDLPRGGDGGGQSFEQIRAMTERLLAPFRSRHIPLTGFVHAGKTQLSPADLSRILEIWLQAGASLGNHTYSHASLNTTPPPDYEQDILKDDSVLRPFLEARGKSLEFFRYPFLQTGPTPKVKHEIHEFLNAHGYRNAPVTLDNSDYMFAAAYLKPGLAERVRQEYVPYLESVVAFFERRSVEVTGSEFPQILLIHASELNSQMMPLILQVFRKRGYRFVSLDDALHHPAYRLPDDYAGPGGFSWIHRWSMTKHMPSKGEPDEPEWVRKAFQRTAAP
ncbi:MAG TPA: class A beta-lactamase [Bryobacteraceae bacterium]|nr:class A beta-lactamase [Bryobacteraceae bacterium]